MRVQGRPRRRGNPPGAAFIVSLTLFAPDVQPCVAASGRLSVHACSRAALCSPAGCSCSRSWSTTGTREPSAPPPEQVVRWQQEMLPSCSRSRSEESECSRRRRLEDVPPACSHRCLIYRLTCGFRPLPPLCVAPVRLASRVGRLRPSGPAPDESVMRLLRHRGASADIKEALFPVVAAAAAELQPDGVYLWKL